MTLESETVDTASPAWARESFLRAIWAEAGASPESISARTYELLFKIGKSLGITHWDLSDGGHWDGNGSELAEIILRNPVRGRSSAEFPIGEALTKDGYSLTFLGSGPTVSTQVRLNAGHISAGGRIPSHHVMVYLNEKTPGAITSPIGEVICAAIAESWQPSNIVWTNSIVSSTARRGNWKIGVGYRTWISAEVGTVSHLVDSLTATELAGGTLISAPDDWPATRVVEAMTATLRENGLDEVPH
ncbi:Uncharacterised protein [Mycobacteroides abscessus subsp. abscessus]|nr:Uncharacterised protein [Mycobacteroides abscessus subsp. abscessus]